MYHFLLIIDKIFFCLSKQLDVELPNLVRIFTGPIGWI